MSMVRIILLGANGQLASDLEADLTYPGEQVFRLSHRDLDICDYGQTTRVLEDLQPDIVINTTAFHKVEACEAEPELAFAINCHAVRNLAQTCDKLEARLVHFSTDYVFAGDRQTPYAEDACPCPVNAYGVSKAAGEQFVRGLCRDYLLIRTSGLYGLAGASSKGGNFVETMLRLGREYRRVSVVTDQVLSPTYTRDLAQCVHGLLRQGAQGIFHVTNSGQCSWNQFARAIFDLSDPAVDVVPTTTASLGGAVRRPSYSVLDNRRLQMDGFGLLRPWREALAEYLRNRSALYAAAAAGGAVAR